MLKILFTYTSRIRKMIHETYVLRYIYISDDVKIFSNKWFLRSFAMCYCDWGGRYSLDTKVCVNYVAEMKDISMKMRIVDWYVQLNLSAASLSNPSRVYTCPAWLDFRLQFFPLLLTPSGGILERSQTIFLKTSSKP